MTKGDYVMRGKIKPLIVIFTALFMVAMVLPTVPQAQAEETVKVQFIISLADSYGYNDLITIDGTSYGKWWVPEKTWVVGSSHTVSAKTPVTGVDGYPKITYYFQSWDNGNGLVSTSGTFVTPDSNTIVTLHYSTSPPPADTALTISCSPSSVNTSGLMQTVISGSLTLACYDTGVSGKTITLSYYDGAGNNTIAAATTGADGSYSYIWNVPSSLPNGFYLVYADFTGDNAYTASGAVTNSNGGLFVLPEYSFGALLALLACFVAFMTFKTRGNLHLKHQ